MVKTETIAALLNNNEYLSEVPVDIGEIAKENRLVIMFGRSDHLLEMRGAIWDELGAWKDRVLYFDRAMIFRCLFSRELCNER